MFKRILAGFILIIAITGTGGFYSLTQMGRLVELTNKIYNHPLRVTTAIFNAETSIVRIHRSLNDISLSSTNAEFEEALSFYHQYEKEVYNNFNTIDEWVLGEAGKVLLNETRKLFTDSKTIHEEIVNLIRAGNQQQAFVISRGRGAIHIKSINGKIKDLKNYATNKAVGMLNDSQKTEETIIKTTSIIFITLIILSGLFGYIISRIISKEVNKRKRVQDKLQVSEERYRLVSENFPNGAVILFDKDLKFVLADGKILRDVGLTSNDMVGRKVKDTLPPDRAEELIPYYESALDGEFKKFDYGYGGLDFEVYTLPVKDAKGNVTFGMSMSQDITVRKQGEKALKESEEKLHLIIDRSSIGICTVDLLGNFIMTNPAYEMLLGYSKEELKELSFYEVTHPDNRPENKKLFQDMFNLKTKDFILEKKYIRKDGMEIDVVVHGIGVRDDEGNTQFGTAFVEDITQRKQAEEQIKASLKEKNTLIDEIHHRVKNNLNIITSLLDLQANSIDDDRTKEILNDSRNRIFAMSAIHETLHGSENLSEIDLKKYLSKITTSIFQSSSVDPSKVKLKTDIEEMPISINQASPLGLIINELISNSLKYAFSDEREGEIIVSMKKLDTELELTIKDDGIGLPDDLDWKKPSTLGLKLIRTLVENQLDGSIDMESNNGTKFIIKFNIDL